MATRRNCREAATAGAAGEVLMIGTGYLEER